MKKNSPITTICLLLFLFTFLPASAYAFGGGPGPTNTPQNTNTGAGTSVQYRSQSSVTTNVGNPPSSGGSGQPATSDTCANSPFYRRYLFDFAHNTVFSPKNFGDPICDYTMSGLATLIHQHDDAHFYCWYNVVVAGESGYDPNVEQLNDPYDPAHAWGNFQMGRGKNGADDHGDVDWQTQFLNALHHNNAQGNTFDYWSTAMRDPVHCHP